MASSDRSPGPIPGGGGGGGKEVETPGKAMTVEQQVLDKGAQMMQSLKPVKQMKQHACTFALYSHDLARQIETHHYVTRLNQDFLQCAVYDSDDSHAKLIGNFWRHSFPISLEKEKFLVVCIRVWRIREKKNPALSQLENILQNEEFISKTSKVIIVLDIWGSCWSNNFSYRYEIKIFLLGIWVLGFLI